MLRPLRAGVQIAQRLNHQSGPLANTKQIARSGAKKHLDDWLTLRRENDHAAARMPKLIHPFAQNKTLARVTLKFADNVGEVLISGPAVRQITR